MCQYFPSVSLKRFILDTFKFLFVSSELNIEHYIAKSIWTPEHCVLLSTRFLWINNKLLLTELELLVINKMFNQENK